MPVRSGTGIPGWLHLKNLISFGVFSLLMLFSSCSPLPVSKMVNGSSLPEYEPKILTAVFSINNKDSVRMVSIMADHGKLREMAQIPYQTQAGDLLISFIGNGREICQQITIQNPLEKTVEFSDDYVTIRKRTVSTDSATFYVRVQYAECMKFVYIEKLSDSSLVSTVMLLEVPIKFGGYD